MHGQKCRLSQVHRRLYVRAEESVHPGLCEVQSHATAEKHGPQIQIALLRTVHLIV